jgi:hypothetical protein
MRSTQEIIEYLTTKDTGPDGMWFPGRIVLLSYLSRSEIEADPRILDYLGIRHSGDLTKHVRQPLNRNAVRLRLEKIVARAWQAVEDHDATAQMYLRRRALACVWILSNKYHGEALYNELANMRDHFFSAAMFATLCREFCFRIPHFEWIARMIDGWPCNDFCGRCRDYVDKRSLRWRNHLHQQVK